MDKIVSERAQTAPEWFALGLITCCSSERSEFFFNEIQEIIYTRWSPNWFPINLLHRIDSTWVISDVAALFLMMSSCLLSQQPKLLLATWGRCLGNNTQPPPRRNEVGAIFRLLPGLNFPSSLFLSESLVTLSHRLLGSHIFILLRL